MITTTLSHAGASSLGAPHLAGRGVRLAPSRDLPGFLDVVSLDGRRLGITTAASDLRARGRRRRPPPRRVVLERWPQPSASTPIELGRSLVTIKAHRLAPGRFGVDLRGPSLACSLVIRQMTVEMRRRKGRRELAGVCETRLDGGSGWRVVTAERFETRANAWTCQTCDCRWSVVRCGCDVALRLVLSLDCQMTRGHAPDVWVHLALEVRP